MRSTLCSLLFFSAHFPLLICIHPSPLLYPPIHHSPRLSSHPLILLFFLYPTYSHLLSFHPSFSLFLSSISFSLLSFHPLVFPLLSTHFPHPSILLFCSACPPLPSIFPCSKLLSSQTLAPSVTTATRPQFGCCLPIIFFQTYNSMYTLSGTHAHAHTSKCCLSGLLGVAQQHIGKATCFHQWNTHTHTHPGGTSDDVYTHAHKAFLHFFFQRVCQFSWNIIFFPFLLQPSILRSMYLYSENTHSFSVFIPNFSVSLSLTLVNVGCMRPR